MGGFLCNQSRRGGRSPGKIDASLNEKLQDVRWGEYKLGDLFEISTCKRKFNANEITVERVGEYPYIVRMGSNNGQKGYLNTDLEYLNEGNTISFGQDTATVFYQERPYFTGDKIKVFKPKLSRFGKDNAQFFLAAMRRSFARFSWGESSYNVEILKNQRIWLPTRNTQIDFEFMESFIAELEARRIVEMEAQRSRELKAYLAVIRQKSHVLTEEDKNVLRQFKTVQLAEYKIEQLFDEEIVRHKLSKEDLSDRFQYPAYSAETANGGIIGYADTAEFICDEHTPIHITFGDHTRVFHIAKESFSVLDNVKVLRPHINHEKALQFIIATWKKQIPNIGYARHWKMAKDCVLLLPTKNNQIDIAFMDRFISAIQKLVINDVASTAQKRIDLTRCIIHKNE